MRFWKRIRDWWTDHIPPLGWTIAAALDDLKGRNHGQEDQDDD